MVYRLAILDWTFQFLPVILDRVTQFIQEATVTTDQTIAAQVADHHRASAGQLPAEIAAAFAAEQRDLAAAVSPAGTARPGERMPDGELLDVAGQPTTLAETLAGRPAVIVFYRGGWCPYCNIALRTYQAQLVPALAERGIPLVAISPQTPDGSLSTKETKELTFTVLSDPGNQIAGQLGILTAPSENVRAAQLQLGLDLTKVNADGTTALPMPTVIIADTEGAIRWIDVHTDYTTRSEPDQILQAIAQTIR
jgi:peroxiredoxin